MFLTLLSLFLKTIGIVITIPNLRRQYKAWRAKETAHLYSCQSMFARTGNKPCIKVWKRVIYRINRMPLPHLYIAPKEESRPSLWKRILRRR